MPRVDYNGLIADVREEDLEAGIDSLRQYSRQERKQILRSVEKELDKALKLTASGKTDLSEQQRRDIANDIGIWFAGEVLAGRVEQYKTLVQ